MQNYRTTQVGDIITNARAVLPCGCAVYVGIDVTHRVSTGALPCTPAHEPVTDRFSGLLRERQRTPRKGKLLVEVCAEVLTEAAREML